PCPMCLTAMYYAGIKDIYYCASIEDAAEVGLGASVDLYADLKKPRSERIHFNMTHMPLQEKMLDPLQEWKKHVKNTCGPIWKNRHVERQSIGMDIIEQALTHAGDDSSHLQIKWQNGGQINETDHVLAQKKA